MHPFLVVDWFLSMLYCIKTNGYCSVEADVGGKGGGDDMVKV